MRAAGTPLRDRVASLGAWAIGLAIVAVAGSALSLAPKRTSFEPGSVVSYGEDRLGRPWTIVRRVGYQTFEIRNGRVLVIAEAGDMSSFDGYDDSSQLSVQLAGEMWRDKLLEIQHARRGPRTTAEVAARDAH